MNKIFSAIFQGIGVFLNMALFCVGAVLAFIKCLQTVGLCAVGYFIFSLISLGTFLLFAYCFGDEKEKHGEWIDANGIRKSKCSNCGTEYERVMEGYHCPICRAKMDGGKAE